MISIIICSVNPGYLKAARQNISDTIGVEHEVIAIDNRKQGDGICKVYNDGAASTKYDFLCFMHEDVKFISTHWGRILSDLLNDESVGLVGVSGSVYKSKVAGTWSACDPTMYRMNSSQYYNNRSPVHYNINPSNNSSAEVSVLDGVFMATRKELWQRFKFDDKLLKGFHGYDIDYSLNIGRYYKLLVSYEISLEHFSEGVLSNKWLSDSFLVHKKWKDSLPKCVIEIEENQRKLSDYISCQCVLNVALKDKKNAWFVLHTYFKLLFNYFRFSRLNYTKSVFFYMFGIGTNRSESV